MNTAFRPALGAAVIAACALAAPISANAGSIGYLTRLCSGQSNGSSAIIAAGHTAVPLSTVDTASLTGLDGLLYINCTGVVYTRNAAIDAAVQAGMVLLMHDKTMGASGTQIPGGSGLQLFSAVAANTDVPTTSPAASGPGGPVNNTSMDSTGSTFYFTRRGFANPASLPAGSVVIATAPDPNQIVTFAYPFGRGRVVYGSVPIDVFMTGGIGFNDVAGPGVRAFGANLIAWGMQLFTTCAAEGFLGAKLTLCRSICETTQSSATLLNKIRLYTAIYRETPPCGL